MKSWPIEQTVELFKIPEYVKRQAQKFYFNVMDKNAE